MRQLVVGGDDGAVAGRVVLRSAGAAEDLEDVEDADVDESAPFGIVDLRALDDDAVGWEVDTPCQGGRATQHLKSY